MYNVYKESEFNIKQIINLGECLYEELTLVRNHEND